MCVDGLSRRRLAETYDDGWLVVQQYRQAAELRSDHPDMASAEIARRVECAPSTVRDWLTEDEQPRPVRAIETARAHGWLDIEQESEQERIFTALSTWVCAAGSIDSEAFVPRFFADDRLSSTVLDQLLGTIEVEYRIEQREGDGEFELAPQTEATVFGRLLSLFGAPVGKKTDQNESTLPAVLDTTDPDDRRLIAQVYLFTCILTADENEDYEMSEPRHSSYLQELAEVFADVTGEEPSVAGQERLQLRATAVDTLCPDEPSRPALAAKIAHGTITPPTERAVLSTFQPADRPSGIRYARAYRDTMARDDPSPTEVAKKYGITRGAVYGWKEGSVPKAIQAVSEVRERGWLDTEREPSEEMRADFAALAAWITGLGSLQQGFHPVFRARTEAHREWFLALAERLDLSTTDRFGDDPERTTEFRVTTGGSRLGRVLYASGVPMAGQASGLLTPPYVWYHAGAARAYLATWVLHHGEVDGAVLHIGTAYGTAARVTQTLAATARDRLGWDIRDQSQDGVTVSYVSARPDLTRALAPGVTTAFERE